MTKEKRTGERKIDIMIKERKKKKEKRKKERKKNMRRERYQTTEKRVLLLERNLLFDVFFILTISLQHQNKGY